MRKHKNNFTSTHKRAASRAKRGERKKLIEMLTLILIIYRGRIKRNRDVYCDIRTIIIKFNGTLEGVHRTSSKRIANWSRRRTHNSLAIEKNSSPLFQKCILCNL